MTDQKLNRIVYELWGTKAWRALKPIQADADACRARMTDLKREADGLLRRREETTTTEDDIDVASAHRAIEDAAESFRRKRITNAWRQDNAGTHQARQRANLHR